MAKSWESYCRAVGKKYKIIKGDHDRIIGDTLADRRGLNNLISLDGDKIIDVYVRQDGRCAICCKVIYFPVPEMNPWGKEEYIRDEYGLDAKVIIDHNHTTNTVRGLLCNRCNGFLPEDEWIGKTLQYLFDTEDAMTLAAIGEVKIGRAMNIDQAICKIQRDSYFDARMEAKLGVRGYRRAKANARKAKKLKELREAM